MCATMYGFVVVVVVVTTGNQIHICRLVLQLLLLAKPSSWPYSDLFLKPHLLGWQFNCMPQESLLPGSVGCKEMAKKRAPPTVHPELRTY